MYWSDGSKYEGTFKDDQISGKGRLIHPKGDYYEGEFENNKANGLGKYVGFHGNSFNL